MSEITGWSGGCSAELLPTGAGALKIGGLGDGGGGCPTQRCGATGMAGGTADPCDDPLPGGNPTAFQGDGGGTPVTGQSPLVLTLELTMSNFPANARIATARGQYHFAGPATITDPGGSTNVSSGDIYTIEWGPEGLAQLRAAWSGNPQEVVKMQVRAEFNLMFGTLSVNDFDMSAVGPET